MISSRILLDTCLSQQSPEEKNYQWKEVEIGHVFIRKPAFNDSLVCHVWEQYLCFGVLWKTYNPMLLVQTAFQVQSL